MPQWSKYANSTWRSNFIKFNMTLWRTHMSKWHSKIIIHTPTLFIPSLMPGNNPKKLHLSILSCRAIVLKKLVLSKYFCVEADGAREWFASVSCHSNILAWHNLADFSWKVYCIVLMTYQSLCVYILPRFETKWNDRHSNQIVAMNSLKALCNHSFHSLIHKFYLKGDQVCVCVEREREERDYV